MATGSDTATFSVKLDDGVSTPADSAAESIESLRKRMADGEKSVKEMSAAMRRLRGTTNEVKKAKEGLKARINAEKDAVSGAQLALLKHKDALKKKPTDDAKDSTSLLTAAMGGLAAAAAAAGAALIGGGVSLATFIIRSADAARSAALLREAVTVGFAGGGGPNGTALGSQIDALSRRLPTAKAQLQDMAATLAKGRLEGQTLVDTFNLIGQASSAIGDEAGGKLKSLVERGAVTKRFQVGDDRFSDDLAGTGLQRDDVAKALAKNLNIGIDKAREALAAGRVKLGDGAKALRDAVEGKFGEINAKKMLSLPVLFQKLEERLQALAKNVNLEPLLNGIESIFSVFDEHTVTGAAIQQLVTLLGNGLSDSVGKSAPTIKQFFKGMIISTLEAAIYFYLLKKRISDAFGSSEVLKNLDTMRLALEAGKLVAITLAVAFAGIAAAVVAMGASIAATAELLGYLWDAGKKAYDFFAGLSWADIGLGIVNGLTGGLLSAGPKLLESVKGLADKVKNGFTNALGIHSPSKVFAGYGENTVEGYQQGVESSAPDAAKSLDAMAPAPAGGGRGGAPVSISMPITIQVQGGTDAAKQITDPGFLAQLSKALEQVLISAGVPARA